MLELLFLLLPLAAAYGWYMGHRSAKQETQEHSNHLSREYVTGLNLILTNQSDKALDHFIELLQLDSEAIDTHLALGNLFRSRGEVDRAIKLHQNLIARTDISIDQKNIALQQLANDYMSAGFLDRAEGILVDLVDEDEHKKDALFQLLTIYQQLREWDKAITVAQVLVKMGKVKLNRDIAHFYCELAMFEIASHAENKARTLLRKALATDKNAVRVSLLLARLDMDASKYKSAIKHLEHILEQGPEFISEALPLITEAYYALDDQNQLIRFLHQCISKTQSSSAVVQLSKLIAEKEGDEVALSYLKDKITLHPTMKGFTQLMEYHIKDATEGRARDNLRALQSLLAERMKNKPHYRCQKCGFESRALYWQCPSCKSWGRVKPIRGLDGE